ncbi:hypothetical protein Lery_2543 [Legionella erythra]|uniref:Uncharacterized protein n=1 Tax=Legionella erythra TaxID=448 RepID=A0A0W0TFK3_LEGER|nr:hypothetical protein Lery_2543 [Legionella erythra]
MDGCPPARARQLFTMRVFGMTHPVWSGRTIVYHAQPNLRNDSVLCQSVWLSLVSSTPVLPAQAGNHAWFGTEAGYWAEMSCNLNKLSYQGYFFAFLAINSSNSRRFSADNSLRRKARMSSWLPCIRSGVRRSVIKMPCTWSISCCKTRA